jgi:hypothetical protein
LAEFPALSHPLVHEATSDPKMASGPKAPHPESFWHPSAHMAALELSSSPPPLLEPPHATMITVAVASNANINNHAYFISFLLVVLSVRPRVA